MATLTELQTRIILDTNRDDLSGDLAQALTDSIADAVENYADELFWFNRKAGNVSTIASAATVALPSGMRIPQVVTYLGTALQKVPLDVIEAQYNASTPVTGVPSKWAEDEGTIHLYPTPDAVYTLATYGIAEIGVPASGAASNEWTTEAFRLILGEAKKILYRGPLRDAEGLQFANDEVEEALTKLRRETRRRGVASLVTDLPVPSAFNIVTG